MEWGKGEDRGHICSWHLELGEVSGRFPIFIITDSGAARESDGDPISCVSLRFGEFSSCDLPHGSFLWVWDDKVRIVDLVDFQPARYLAGILEEKRCYPIFPSQNQT